MARRRKAKYTWLPVRGSQVGFVGEGEAADFATYTDITVTTVDGSPAVAVIPLVEDEPSEDERELQHESLADAIGSDYVARRIVGKVHCHAFYSRVGNIAPVNVRPIHVKCGIFVARADDDLQVPIAWNTAGLANYGPTILRNVREPWLWQRSWILGPSFLAAVAVDPGATADDVAYFTSLAYPPSNAFYGSVMDGPHIDVKVARRVTTDNRLWFCMNVETFPDRTRIDTSVSHNVLARVDVRVLGALRRARNSSAF